MRNRGKARNVIKNACGDFVGHAIIHHYYLNNAHTQIDPEVSFLVSVVFPSPAHYLYPLGTTLLNYCDDTNPKGAPSFSCLCTGAPESTVSAWLNYALERV